MDSEKLKALICTIEKGSLSAAAEELGYTPSGISRMMASLETELGFPLEPAQYAEIGIASLETVTVSARAFLEHLTKNTWKQRAVSHKQFLTQALTPPAAY